jgi:hypothetical protein
LYALPAVNKWWFPFDEGITLTCVEILSRGGNPYKDFVTPFGPAQLYILAFLFKVFGANIVAARLYILLIHAIVCTATFYGAYRLSGEKGIAYFIWLVGLSCFAPRMGPVATSIWPAMGFSAISAVFFVFYIDRRSARDLVIAGLFAGLTFLSRFEFGLFVAASELVIILSSGPIRNARRAFLYAASFAILPGVFLFYIFRVNAIGDFLNSAAIPYSSILRFGHSKFPPPCLDPRLIFYRSLFFITVNQHYIPVIAYAASIIAAVYLYARRKIEAEKLLIAIFLSLVGTLMFSYIYYGADATHTMPAIFPALMLSGLVLKIGMKRDDVLGWYFRLFMKTAATLLLLLLVLLTIKNTDKYIKNAFVKPLKRDIVLVDTGRGKIYVPKSEAEDLRAILEFIKSNTVSDERIFIGFDSHKELLHGGEPILYFLSGRQPAARYFFMMPGVSNRSSTQEEIVSSLKDTKSVFLTSQGKIMVDMPCAGVEISGILDNYIRDSYLCIGTAGKYSIYRRKLTRP